MRDRTWLDDNWGFVIILSVSVLFFIFMVISCCHESKKPPEIILEKDGCKVYRFWDGGERYFTTCQGSVQWTEQQGRVMHPVEIQTMRRE